MVDGWSGRRVGVMFLIMRNIIHSVHINPNVLAGPFFSLKAKKKRLGERWLKL